jgi:hypothetical protein
MTHPAMNVKALDFNDVVLELQGWFGLPVVVTVSYAARTAAARMTGILNRALEPDAETRRHAGELAEHLEVGEAARSVLESFARPPDHDVPLYVFTVGGEEPDRLCWFSLNKAEVTEAYLHRDHSVDPATPMLTILSGAQTVTVSTGLPEK